MSFRISHIITLGFSIKIDFSFAGEFNVRFCTDIKYNSKFSRPDSKQRQSSFNKEIEHNVQLSRKY